MWKTFALALKQWATLHPLNAAGAVSLYLLSIALVGFRWRKILQGLKTRPSPVDTSLGVLMGIFVNNITPSSRMGGDLFRVLYIRKRISIPWRQAVLSVVYDRMLNLLLGFLTLLLALPTLRHLALPFNHYFTLVLLALPVLGLFLWISPWGRRIGNWFRQRIKLFSDAKLDPKKLGGAVGLTLLLWLQDLLRLFTVASAFGIVLRPGQVAVLSLSLHLSSLVPAVGGLGVSEGGMTAALLLLGFPLETALAVTLLERSISYGLGTGLGGLAAFLMGGVKGGMKGLKKLRKSFGRPAFPEWSQIENPDPGSIE